MMQLFGLFLVGFGVLFGGSFVLEEEGGNGDARDAIGEVLDAFHSAAAAADFEGYFGCLTDDAVFLGTDGGERWSVAEFKAFAKPYFDRGQGWTYVKQSRHIFVNADETAGWFDEVVANASYGDCRGTGALVKVEEGGWKIAQFNLVIPVPNDFAGRVVRANRSGVSEARTVYVIRHVEKAAEPRRDPALSVTGIEHLGVLQAMLRDVEFAGVYSSDYARTRLTAAAFVGGDEDAVTLYDADDSAGLVEVVKGLEFEGDGKGGNVLVVGHSNTVPKVLKELGVTEEVVIGDGEYDNLFVVRIDELGVASLMQLHF